MFRLLYIKLCKCVCSVFDVPNKIIQPAVRKAFFRCICESIRNFFTDKVDKYVCCRI